VKVISPRKTLSLRIVEDFTPAELDSAIRSFNEEDFLHARFVFSVIERRSKSIENRHIFSTLARLCDFYINWDDFNYNAARGILKIVYSELEDLEKQIKHFVNIRVSLQENEKSLDRLNKVFLTVSKEKELIMQTHDFLHLLLDILLKGKRLQKLGKYHDACMRYYRVLEGIVQHRLLKQYGFDVKKPDYDALCRKVHLTKEEFCRGLETETLPLQLAFNEGFLILKGCHDDFAKKIDSKIVQSLQHARNNSILVHGTNPLKKETVEKLGAFAEQTLKELFATSELNFDAYSNQSMPCTLNVSMLIS
jgi:CRISPR-associated protein (TIGR02710 family)